MGNERGMALPMVLMVMMVSSILAGALIYRYTESSYSLHVATEKTQAYYIARSGIEATVEYINRRYKAYDQTSMPDLKNKESQNYSFNSGYFSVKVAPTEKEDELLVTSTGIIGDTTQKISLRLTPSIYTPPAGSDVDEYTSARDLGWLVGGGQAGVLQEVVNNTSTSSVLFETNDRIEIQLNAGQSGSDNTITYKAPIMCFYSDLEIHGSCKLILNSDVIIFRGNPAHYNNVIIDTNPTAGEISFIRYNNDDGLDLSSIGISADKAKYGLVYFKNNVTFPQVDDGAYYFPSYLPGYDETPFNLVGDRDKTYKEGGLIPYRAVHGYDGVWKYEK